MEQVMTESQLADHRSESLAAEPGTEMRKFLSFFVNGEVYALNALRVKEIIEYVNITRVPMVPAYIRGVTNLRGSVVPVIDLAARLGKRITPQTKRTCIVIVEFKYDDEIIDLGVVIDSINEVFNISEDDIEPAPSFGAGIRADFISGMGRVADKFVVLLNVEKVLSIEELSLLKDDSGLSAKVAASRAVNAEKANSDTEAE